MDDGWLLIALAVIAVAAASALSVTTVLWQRERRRVTKLQRELESEPVSGLLPRSREAVKTVWETAALVKEKGVSGWLRSSIEELAGWAEVERPDLARLAAGDGSVTILFSDIEGSTALNEQLGDKGWIALLQRHDRIVRRCVEEHEGHVIKTQGDGFMVAFGPAENATQSAVAIQQALGRRRRRARRTIIKVRIGIHRGDAVHRDGDLFGRNVAFAARVANDAPGGEILVSDAVRDAILENETEPDGIVFTDGREIEIKGLSGTHRVYTVRWDGEEGDEESEPEDVQGED